MRDINIIYLFIIFEKGRITKLYVFKWTDPEGKSTMVLLLYFIVSLWLNLSWIELFFFYEIDFKIKRS